MPANLRKIWNVSFWNCQHYREWGPSDRAMPANLRKIRSVSFWICQPYRRSGASDRTMPANLRRIGIAHQNCDASGVSGAGRVPFPSCRGDFCCRGNVSATFRRAVPIIRGDCRKFNIYIDSVTRIDPVRGPGGASRKLKDPGRRRLSVACGGRCPKGGLEIGLGPTGRWRLSADSP